MIFISEKVSHKNLNSRAREGEVTCTTKQTNVAPFVGHTHHSAWHTEKSHMGNYFHKYEFG